MCCHLGDSRVLIDIDLQDLAPKTLNLLESMKAYSLRLTLGCAFMPLAILTSCTAQRMAAFQPSNQSTTALPTGVSEIRDRNNFRDEQQAAPRVNNAPINP